LISNFKGLGNLARLGEIVQGDLDGIWTWNFFLNSSTLRKDFLKNTICHAMNAILGQLN
jgi:hypothetical protein